MVINVNKPHQKLVRLGYKKSLHLKLKTGKVLARVFRLKPGYCMLNPHKSKNDPDIQLDSNTYEVRETPLPFHLSCGRFDKES